VKRTFSPNDPKPGVFNSPLSIIARKSLELKNVGGDGMERGLGGEVACSVNDLTPCKRTSGEGFVFSNPRIL
jgi:hypothetical protein